MVESPSDSIVIGRRLDARSMQTDATPYTDSGFILALDGRLDNRAELRQRLSDDGMMLAPDASDEALMLATYRVWGESAFEKWLGDFAVILWDSAERRLLCIRDQMGVKPLFYLQTPDMVAVASEVRVLAALPHISRRIDETMLSVYLTNADMTDCKAHTFYEAIKRVVNGHFIEAHRDSGALSVQSKTYWRLRPLDARYDTDDEYASAFRAILDDAARVRRAGWSNTEIGAALSGGMDSSSVVCLLRANGDGVDNTPFHTFYMQPDLKTADESAYVDDVLAGGGVIHHRASVPSVFDGGASIYDVMDMPTFWFNLPLSIAMYRMAADLGVRAFFDGMDGDMVISYGRRGLTQWLERGERARFKSETYALAKAERESRRQTPLEVMSKYAFPLVDAQASRGDWRGVSKTLRGLSADFSVSPFGLGAYWARNYFIPERFTRAAQGIRRGEPLRWQRWQQDNPMLNPDFVRRNDIEARLRAADAQLTPINAQDDHARIIQTGRLALAFEDADKIGTAHGITPLHLLSDRRVLEFCYSLPPEQRLRNGLSRWILRQAVRDILPPSIVERGDKTDFGAAFTQTMRTHDLPFLDTVFSNLESVAAYVNPSAAQAAYGAFRAGSAHVAARTTMLIRIARLALWLNRVRI